MSSFLIVNGVEFPTPKRGFKITVVTNVDAGVNASGSVIGQVIGRNQYKLDSMSWAWLDADTWERMLQAVEPFYIPVTFEDPQTRERKTITMYPGNRTGEPYFLGKDGKIERYLNCQFNLIDCGWE